MPPRLSKTLKVSIETHHSIKMLAAKRGVSMAALLEDMVATPVSLAERVAAGKPLFTEEGARYIDKLIQNVREQMENTKGVTP